MPLTKIKTDVIANLDASKLYGTFGTNDGSALTGLSTTDWDLRYNLALNFFNDSVKDNMDRLSLHQGWVDTFEDASDVVDEGFNVPLTKFDGTNDSLFASSGVLADSKTYTFSFWIDLPASSDGQITYISDSLSSKFLIQKNAANEFRIRFRNTSNVTIGDVRSTFTFTNSDGPTHVGINIDLANGTCKFFKDKVEDTTQVDTALSDANWDVTDTGITLFSAYGNNLSWDGSIGQFYISTELTDFSVAENMAKFVSADGNPVDLGSDGSTPTGTQPHIFLNNPFGTFQNNLGSGGNFSVASGSLVDGGYLDTNALYSSESFSNSYELIDYYGKENNDNNFTIGATGGAYHVLGVIRPSTAGEVIHGFSFFIDENTDGCVGNLYGVISKTTGTIDSDAISDGDFIAVSSAVDSSSLGTTRTVVKFTFPTPYVIDSSEDYFFGIDGSSVTGQNVAVGLDFTSPTGTWQTSHLNSSGTWTADIANGHIPFYLYGQKNLDLITKGSDDIGNSPAAAPDTGHMEILMTEPKQILQTQVAQTYGAAFGNMTIQNGQPNGVAKAFDGVKIAVNGSASGIALGTHAGSTPNGHYFVGKDWGAGVTKTISGVKTWGSNNEGYSGGNVTATVKLMGSNAQPSQASQGTELGTVFLNIPDVNNANPKEKLYGFDVTTAYRYHWLYLTNNGNHDGFFVEIEFYEKTYGDETATINTDIIGQISRDGGTAWTDIPLTRIKTQVGGTNNNILVGEADLTSTSGTNIKGRIKTANKDKITVDGISVNWS